MKNKFNPEACRMFIAYLDDFINHGITPQNDLVHQLAALVLYDLRCRIFKKMIGFEKKSYSVHFTKSELLALLMIPDFFKPKYDTIEGILILNLYNHIEKAMANNGR